MQMKKKDTFQIPLFGTVRIKKTKVTSAEIRRLKMHLHREGAKILSIIIKPSNKKEGKK
jgi:hypothetical protein